MQAAGPHELSLSRQTNQILYSIETVVAPLLCCTYSLTLVMGTKLHELDLYAHWFLLPAILHTLERNVPGNMLMPERLRTYEVTVDVMYPVSHQHG
jgi:hypothetical protein